jgi:NAD(P)-dependent dehydrogenase (short-subunit alcohol dehydrogenase family)
VKTVCISGVSRGIGKGLAERYLEDGCRVIGSTRRARDAAALDLGRRYGDLFVPLVMDVADRASVDRAAAAAARIVAAIDLLICNAGFNPELPGPAAPLSAIEDEVMMRTFDVNVIGVLRTVRAFHRLLAAGSEPRLLIITSAGGSISSAVDGAMLPYRVSKAAANMLSRRLHFILEADGIPVLAVHPGWVKTDMGGPAARVAVEDSAAGIARIAAAYRDGDPPYQDYTGKPLAW